MSAQTKIEWCDRTASPWYGCQHVSPACDHCYAEAWAKRSGRVGWGAHADRVRSKSFRQTMEKWNREAARLGVTYSVFASLCDPLDNAVPIDWFCDYLDVLRTTPNLTHLLLTKRIGNWQSRLDQAATEAARQHRGDLYCWICDWINGDINATTPANVWIGSTFCNQDEWDRDYRKLMRVPAVIHFASIEPMLCPINAMLELDLYSYDEGHIAPRHPGGQPTPGLDWMIVGGESGPHARPMHPDWVRSLRDQCAAAGVSFHFKQWGEWAPGNAGPGGDLYDIAWKAKKKDAGMFDYNGRWNEGGPNAFRQTMVRIGKAAAGRLLDGREHNEFPAVSA